MSSPPAAARPARIMFAALLLVLGAVGLTIILVLDQPWLGLRLGAPADNPGVSVEHIAPDAPARALPPGARLLAIAAPDGSDALALQSDDLLDAPDTLDRYADMDRFFARQEQLATLLRQPVVLLVWLDEGAAHVTKAHPERFRPPRSLPLRFWFQLLCGAAALLLGAWVFALRPGQWRARLFALSGVMLLGTTYAAAICNTRELALPAELFRTLAAASHLGALGFGGTLAALFLIYPARLVSPYWLVLAPLAVAGAWAANHWQLAPNTNWGVRAPVLAEMLLAIGLAVVQWHRSARRAADRAALRWFIIAAALASGLFVTLTLGSRLVGVVPPLRQGFGVGFLLMTYVGLALGVSRYRLFDLDRWAYRVLLLAIALVLAVIIDLVLVLVLGWQQDLSLAFTLLIVGLLYLPLRQWAWNHMARSQLPPVDRLLPEVIDVAFTPQRSDRERRWVGLLDRLFQPLQNTAAQSATDLPQAGIVDDGSAMLIPAAGGLQPRCLQSRNEGLRLFTADDKALADNLARLLDQAADGRDAIETNVQRERERIASDLHDDIGAKLLTLRHLVQGDREQALLLTTIDQVRAIVRGLQQPAQPWDEFAADLRAALSQRVSAAGMLLDWPAPLISGEGRRPPRLPPPSTQDMAQQYHLRALLQEAVSNAIRHAKAQTVHVRMHLTSLGDLHLDVIDDGVGMELESAGEGSGHGLLSMQARARAMGGHISWTRLSAPAIPGGKAAGTHVALHVPLRRGTRQPTA